VEIKEDAGGRVTVNRDYAPHGSYEITVHNVEAADSGEYSATAINTVGQESCSAAVGVKEAKVFFSFGNVL